MIAGLEWGCPFVLYWELYDNEGTPEKPGGFWLINERGEKQPIWNTHLKYYAWARQHVKSINESTGKPPSDRDFRHAAIDYLKSQSLPTKP